MATNTNVEVRLNLTMVNLTRLTNELKNMKEPLTQSATYMEGSIGRRFAQAPWTPLAASTIKRHPHRAGGKPLNDGGTLRGSVTGGAIKNVGRESLHFGTNLPYAALHNFGGATKFGYVPQRQFLYFDSKDEAAIKRVFEEYIKGLAN
ncbi:tail completion protein [Staphylococcus phage MVC_VPHSA2]|uniref:Tail completion protein n=1 Tax=Staphylococcus phage MVC_VPHSA1 TaxID=3088876 RepID=A0ABZ0QZR8_9CAUD|nr:tail completion protein [Staphylococcus phage MVC_VPHSA1]WPF64964.1 tail completion protein [Staphylococcus phage MVC_VPHSA2]